MPEMYRFKTVPFGVCNAGKTFQRLMDWLEPRSEPIHLDDIIVCSKSIEEHLNKLDLVLGKLRQAGLKLNKCTLLQKSVVDIWV